MARTYIEGEVHQRLTHASVEDVRTTCSFARMERLLSRDHHGRFLIELLQNAADAWRADERSSRGRSRVAVMLTEGPALLVANEGAPMTAEVVIESLGHIGASTKQEGDAIGHKGIGFKSVLEISRTPEIYSGLAASEPALAVRFDPRASLGGIADPPAETIRHLSPRWDDFVAHVLGPDEDDELFAVPVLRYPRWVEELPPDVRRLAAEGFDTVVRLPFDVEDAGRLHMDTAKWLQTVREAIAAVSDEILLLLGCFDEVRVEDRLTAVTEVIRPIHESAPAAIDAQTTKEVVRVERAGGRSSRWRLHRRTLPGDEGLAAEVAVGVRIEDLGDSVRVVSAGSDDGSAPFHLFFPTRIASGLPFLLHGYFEVDANRTSFYQGSMDRNRVLLDALAELVATAVADLGATGTADLASLANCLAAPGEPEDKLAKPFRGRVFDLLDDVAWIPTRSHDDMSPATTPAGVLIASPAITRLAARTFPAAYVQHRLGLGVPVDELDDDALVLIASRRSSELPDFWALLAELLRPGTDLEVWDADAADGGFLALLDLLSALEVEDRSAARQLLEGLRGDPASRLLPTVGMDPKRVLLPVPDPSEAVAGRRSLLVMARVRSAGSGALVPPPELEVAFLRDELLDSETQLDRAKPLGVRPFTVDNILDRLNGIADLDVDKRRLLQFLWGLLARERVSGFGTRRCAELARAFNPAEWFWCVPGRARIDDNTRLRQQRERYLADVPVPTRDGEWRPAGQVAFGADWAAWLRDDSTGSATTTAPQERIVAYEAMERLAPNSAALLAPPEVLLDLLHDEPFTQPFVLDEEDDEGEHLDHARRNAERHAFLLRLGVWEVPPLAAFESRDPAGRDRFPWTGRWADHQRQAMGPPEGWTFGLDGWSGNHHQGDNVYLGEDFRFLWPLELMAAQDPQTLIAALGRGHDLYRDRVTASVFCTRCSNNNSSHTAWRHSSDSDAYPSLLHLELRHAPWLACSLDGTLIETPVAPQEAWWHANPPTGAGLRQSPWRLVPLCGPQTAMTHELSELAGLNTLHDADLAVVEELLLDLRSQFDQQRLVVDPLNSGSARQAFIGLHRLAYERLAEIATTDRTGAHDLLARVGLLCELGDRLVYRSPDEARHDDGKHAGYVRHFAGKVPLVVLPRERERTANAIGVDPLIVNLTRLGDDVGQDVTDEARDLLGHRIPELLAIVVHHSLGTQTLEVTSNEFDLRSRRLQALRLRQVDDLVVEAAVDGTTHSETIGHGADRDLFLDDSVPSAPVLYHDFTGPTWTERLRRKIAPYYATLLENPAYNHTFALFLQADGDAEREEFLVELGITNDEVDAIVARIGAVTEQDRDVSRRWFTAIIEQLGGNTNGTLDLDPEALRTTLTSAGLSAEVAQRLIEAGGGLTARRDASDNGPLWILARSGIFLRDLDASLHASGDPGLQLTVYRTRFFRWMDAHGRRLAAVLAPHLGDEDAKGTVRLLQPPPHLGSSLDPPMHELLGEVIDQLAQVGISVDVKALAGAPEETLAAAAGLATIHELDASVDALYDAEEQKRVLRERASQWRKMIRLLAVLARIGPGDTRASIRAVDEQVGAKLPSNPQRPSDLSDGLDELLAGHPRLHEHLAGCLIDTIGSPPPSQPDLLEVAEHDKVDVTQLRAVERALEAPRRDRARSLIQRSNQLEDQGIRPIEPPELRPMAPPPPPPPATTIRKVKVDPSHDRRKRQVGDEGELWALSSVVKALTDLESAERDVAIGELIELLSRFDGAPVEDAIGHTEAARSQDIDEEELVDELTGLLHVSSHSDAFGFDLLGWLPAKDGQAPQAMCLEVKSSGGEGFHLSTGEWRRAEELHDGGSGSRYAVLVVRRAKGGGVPAAMDLLVDPVRLRDQQHLYLAPDGYQVTYSVG